MYCTRQITPGITWVGGNDRRLERFENLFPVPRGVSYNTYLIMDEKVALMDTADSAISRQFMDNVMHTLNGRSIDYLVVNHMEPDHCAAIEDLMLRFPEMKLVGNAKTMTLISQFYDMPLEGHSLIVKEGDTLSLGEHTLQFFFAPMVHWPEVMMTYEQKDGVLFSADAFGGFGALSGNIFDDEVDFERDWLDDYRRYYANIVGKYGMQVQATLKKLSALDIHVICPLHGLIWRDNLSLLLEKYDLWSRYEPEEQSVAIFYGSMYGDTENAAEILAGQLADAGIRKIAMYDVSGTNVSTLISEVFRCSHVVLAAPTYNNGIYPPMLGLLHDMKALNVQNRTIAIVENGSWAPTSAKNMRELLDSMKNMTVLEPVVSVRSAPGAQTLASIESLVHIFWNPSKRNKNDQFLRKARIDRDVRLLSMRTHIFFCKRKQRLLLMLYARGVNVNMVYGAIDEKSVDGYTLMGRVFDAIQNKQMEYNWLITNVECLIDRIAECFMNNDYCWLTGEELTKIVREDDGQWIWAVLSGLRKGYFLVRSPSVSAATCRWISRFLEKSGFNAAPSGSG